MVKSMMKFWSKKASETEKVNQKRKAFTLVEILIVVAVIGILFVTLVPRIDFAGDKARETGVKTDFRSFELAAEQILRENAGLGDFDGEAALCGDNGINLYLDKAIQFDDASFECAKDDQWNQPYTIQVAKPADGNPNNGAIIFVSNGKDSLLNETDDNYVLVVTFVDGQIESATQGFSSNIESDAITITAGGADATTEIDADANTSAVEYATE